MSTLTRPNIELRLSPVPSSSSQSNGSSYIGPYNKAAYYVLETSTGTRRRKPRGWLPPTPYTFERREIYAGVGSAKYMPSGYPANNGQWFTGVSYVVPGDTGQRGTAISMLNRAYHELNFKSDDGLRNAALIAARNRLKTTNIDLGLAFAERKQVERLVGDTTTRIGRAFRELSRGNVRRSMNQLGIASKRSEPRGANVPRKWLEMQYGWKPLLSDVYGACDSLATRNREDWRVTAKATRSNRVYASTNMRAGTDYWNEGVSSAVVHKSVFVRIDALPENEILISLSSLGLLNPLSVAWEKTYLSFVVDWFIPIGSFFDSLDAMIGYSTAAYSSSLLVRGEWSFAGNPKYIGPSGRRSENNAKGGQKWVYLSRQVSGSTPVPRIPGFKDPRSLTHMANGLALLAGAFGRAAPSRGR